MELTSLQSLSSQSVPIPLDLRKELPEPLTQIHATLVAVAHNFRPILRKLRLFCIETVNGMQKLLWMGPTEISLLAQAS